MGKRGGKWRHGFKPANMSAALMKAHGNRHYAAKLMGRSGGAKKSPIKATIAARRRKRSTSRRR